MRAAIALRKVWPPSFAHFEDLFEASGLTHPVRSFFPPPRAVRPLAALDEKWTVFETLPFRLSGGSTPVSTPTEEAGTYTLGQVPQ